MKSPRQEQDCVQQSSQRIPVPYLQGRRKGRSDTGRCNPKLSLDSFDTEDILNEFDNLLISALGRAAITVGDASYEPADNIDSTSSTKQSSTPQTTLRHSRGQGFTKRLPVSLT